MGSFLFIDYAFYFVFFLALFWFYAIADSYGKYIYDLLKRDWLYLLFSLAATVVLFITLTVDYKILSDETNLLSVSRILAGFHKAANNTQGVRYYEVYHAISLEPPTRPLLFPLLTAFLHLLLGVSDRNPLILNFLLSWLFLYSVSLFFGEKKSTYRWLSILAIAASPVFSIHATSGGFDICSALFGLWAILLTRSYLANPDNNAKLSSLVLTLLCFASVRYEMILALPIFFIILLAIRGKSLIMQSLHNTLLLVSPLLFLPILWQRIITWGQFENPEGIPAFGIYSIAKHFGVFLQSFFSPATGPYLFYFHLLGILGFLSIAVKKQSSEKIAFWGISALFGILLLLILSHHMGVASHPTQVRLFLPFSAALVILGIRWIDQVNTKKWKSVLLAAAALQIYLGHAYAVHDPLSSQLILTRETHFVRQFLAPMKQEPILLIYDRPGQFTAFGYSSVDFQYFASHQSELLQNIKDGLYSKILVFQHKNIASGQATGDSKLFPNLPLRELKKFEISDSEFLLISEIAMP